MPECDTPYREGFFMSSAEQKGAKGNSLVDYAETKERRALLENEAENLAKNLESIAELLSKRPASISFNDVGAVLPNAQKRFGALVRNLRVTRTELQGLDTVFRNRGFCNVLNKD